MKKGIYMVMALLSCGCASREYWQQPLPKKLVSPKLGLAITIKKDTIGQLENNRPGQEPLIQQFSFSKASSNSSRCFVIKNVSPEGKSS